MDAERQADMFATGMLDRPQTSTEALTAEAHRRLHALLATARGAERMPWDETRAQVHALLFHQMANWQPEAERDAVRDAFVVELARLRAAG